MPEKSHSAIARYKARRAGRIVPDLTTHEREAIRESLNPTPLTEGDDQSAPNVESPRTRKFTPYRGSRSSRARRPLILVGIGLLVVMSVLAWSTLPGPDYPVQLTYEIDLLRAPAGALTITMIAEGKLPGDLEMKAAPGLIDNFAGGVLLSSPTAFELDPDGNPGKPLAITDITDGWRITTAGAHRAGLIYEIDLTRASGSEEDIRQHISIPVEGGVRAAGFEIFLLPAAVPVNDITVMIHNPQNLPVVVPWPALVRGIDRPDPAQQEIPLPPPQVSQSAHLGLGQGFQPAPDVDLPAVSTPPPGDGIAVPVPANLFFHPKDLADLNNALLICGDIRTLSVQTRDCVIQLATDQDWLFADEAALDLVRRIARTELGFFGSAPCDQITVLLSANRITAQAGFDVYGIHTGSSVLVLMSPETTYGLLEEQVVSVVAHEMFHGWLGEAIRQTDPQTLWFTEGVTTWYSARMLIAAGLWTPDHARGVLMARLERDYVNSDLQGTITLADAAAEVMAGPEQVRYAYAGGVAASMALDQWLASASGLQRPLDEVLRYLYAHHQGQDLSRELIEEAIHSVTGVDSHSWLETHIYGRSALPPLEQLI
jgi:Peptidase family M1 domain